MIRIHEIINQIHSYLLDADVSPVEKAYVYAAKVHDGQVRLSGEPYLSHPLEVSYILSQMHLDIPSIAAGLLHDTVEDTLATIEEIAELFGSDVADIVDGVTKLSKIQFHSRLHKQAENIRKMILAMSKDLRVILVKLADRLHNMRTLEFQKEHKRIKISRETMDIYAPLASRLGIDWIKRELEDLSFKYIHPAEYESLQEKVEAKLGKRKSYIEVVKDLIARRMAEFGLSCRVLGRPKHLYSIYRKMKLRNLTFDEIYDLIAFRIILNTPKECYEALGIVHSLWKPVPGRFKDYISLPKANMYQSLHTTVIGPEGEKMEIQIRTEEMDRVAREGIAAHWLYKEGKIITPDKERQFDWLTQLTEWQKELEDPREFLDYVKMDLFPNEVYVFTPRGEVKEFPRGATPIDFAYAVHTEVGHRCVGAKVNGKMVPLKYELQNGDVVEIITSPQHMPSRDWLKMAKTSRALTRIRNWIKTEEKERILILGKELLLREFKKHREDFAEFLKQYAASVAQKFSIKSIDEMLIAVGYGKLSPLQVYRKYQRIISSKEEDAENFDLSSISEANDRQKGAKEAGISQEGIIIQGIDNVMVHLGKCCSPVPGDEVIGYITRGRGITVHRTDCVNIRSLDPDRKVEVSWHRDGNETYPVKLRVMTLDKKGMLAAVSNAITNSEGDIKEAKIMTTLDQSAVFNLIVAVSDNRQLRRIIREIRKVDGVTWVERSSVV